MSRFPWRHQYNEADEIHHGEISTVHNDQPSLTQQHFTADADINNIVRKFGIHDGSQIPTAISTSLIDPHYWGDFTEATDFRGALDRIKTAQERFAMLPADLRSRFDNDPTYLFDWVSNPANAEEAVKLGLLSKHTPPEPPSSTRKDDPKS